MDKRRNTTAQSLGGRARAEKLTSDERQLIARTAAKTRWERQLPADLKRAVAEGELRLAACRTQVSVFVRAANSITRGDDRRIHGGCL